MNWSKEELDKTGLKNNYSKGKTLEIKKPSLEKSHIQMVLINLKQSGTIDEFNQEYKFDAHRKFRFDWAIPSKKIAIEYEGLFSYRSGHTTVTGYTKDCEKYNLAQLKGWKVLRYTAINYGQVYDDLIKFTS